MCCHTLRLVVALLTFGIGVTSSTVRMAFNFTAGKSKEVHRAVLPQAPRVTYEQYSPPLVDMVEVAGTRRLRNENILYYVQTRAGDSYNGRQVQRDLQAILALGYFDKTATRVVTRKGERGGVEVTFIVKELRQPYRR